MSFNLQRFVNLKKKYNKIYLFLRFFYKIFAWFNEIYSKIFIFIFFKFKIIFFYKFNIKIGVTKKKRKTLIVANVTTIPSRLGNLNFVIETIFKQTLKADKVILWLPKKYRNPKFKDFDYNNLPKRLVDLKKRGLEINYIEDLGPHTKIIYALKKYKNSIIITFDDDTFYPKNHFETLHKAYESNKEKFIYCYKSAFAKKLNNRSLEKYNKWKNCGDFNGAKKNVFFKSVNGVFYPPNFFSKKVHKIVIDSKAFMKLSKYNDDIWIFSMALLDKKSCFNVSSKNVKMIPSSVNKNDALFVKNVLGGRNDIQLKNVFDQYNLYKFL